MHHSTCGRFITPASRTAGCERIDHGSCGNACCIVQLTTKQAPARSYATLLSWLSTGGVDGSYRYTNGSDALGHRPTDQLGVHVPESDGHVRVSLLPDQYILQGRHITRGGYVDILNFYMRSLPSGGTVLRAASTSGIHGAFSDNGQNFKSLDFMFRFLHPSAVQTILFGCGHPETQASRRGAIPQAISPISSMVPGQPPALALPNTRQQGSGAASSNWAGAASRAADDNAETGAAQPLPPRGSYHFALEGTVHQAKRDGAGSISDSPPAADLETRPPPAAAATASAASASATSTTAAAEAPEPEFAVPARGAYRFGSGTTIYHASEPRAATASAAGEPTAPAGGGAFSEDDGLVFGPEAAGDAAPDAPAVDTRSRPGNGRGYRGAGRGGRRLEAEARHLQQRTARWVRG